MKNVRHILFSVGVILILGLGLSFYLGPGSSSSVEASSHLTNVSGYAWSSNIGWISFNCVDGGELPNPNVCSSSDYGVNIDSSTGVFSGHAWSEHLGWLSFERSETGTPPAEDPVPGDCANCLALLDWSAGPPTVKGWARFLSAMDAGAGGWDGWIQLNHTAADPVTLNTVPDPSEFMGWVWGGDPEGVPEEAVVGWISVNCSNEGVCASSDYKVRLDAEPPVAAPEARNLSVGAQQYCASPPRVEFIWEYFDSGGNPQEEFSFQVDNDSNFLSPAVNRTVASAATSQWVNVVSGGGDPATPDPGDLDYNATYYWRVMVKNSEGVWSEWADGGTYDTEPHRYPSPDFSWSPLSPALDQEITFDAGSSVCYSVPCIVYEWDFTNDGTIDRSGPSPIATWSYGAADTYPVLLNVIDNDLFSCSRVNSVPVETTDLPKWKEVPPVGWIINILNGVANAVAGVF